MKIEIRNRWTDGIIIEGEYENVKDCLEKNRGAYLGDADLGGANLGGAYLRGANLGGAYLGGVKIKITQKENLLKALGIEIVE